MAKPGSVIGWKLDRGEREALLAAHPPCYEEVVADHVTLAVDPDAPLPSEVRAAIVGRTDDGHGVEAMVVTIDGSVDRPDGSTYHITWSLGPGRRARESNDVLKERGWQGARPSAADHADAVPLLAVPRLFLDCDGVLADFDGGIQRLFGMDAARAQAKYGRGGFWKRIAAHGDFYFSLEPLPDADRLVEAVLPLSPTILTGLPLGNWAAPQKVRWAERHFPGLPVITCMARDKHCHGAPGDVLVDDTVRNGVSWETMGGVFVLHENVERTLGALRKLFGNEVAQLLKPRSS